LATILTGNWVNKNLIYNNLDDYLRVDIGHQLGFGQEYQQGINELDDYVGRIITASQQRTDENWLNRILSSPPIICSLS